VSSLRVGAFLSARFLPFYEAAARAAGAALGREAEVVTEASFRDLESGALDAAVLCGLPYVVMRDREDRASRRVVKALAAPASASVPYNGDAVYFSKVLARADETRGRLEEFRGGVLAVNEPKSHSGHNVVGSTLAQREAPVGGFAKVLITGGHAESVAAVRSGRADVAAVDSHLLSVLQAADPGIDADLTEIEVLGPSPSQPFTAGPELEPGERDLVRAALVALPPVDLAPGLEGVRWVAVDDSDYDVIRQMRAAAVKRGSF